MCLGCGAVRCSRYAAGHALAHGEAAEEHCLVLSWSDLSVWCYACDAYVTHDALEVFLKQAEARKFDLPPVAVAPRRAPRVAVAPLVGTLGRGVLVLS